MTVKPFQVSPVELVDYLKEKLFNLELTHLQVFSKFKITSPYLLTKKTTIISSVLLIAAVSTALLCHEQKETPLSAKHSVISPPLFAVSTKTAEYSSPLIKQADMFFDRASFDRAKESAKTAEAQNNIEAIIVPHHLLASEIIAKLMKKASGREVKTIAIIGPNHANTGGQLVATAKARWQTDAGEIVADETSVNKLEADLEIYDDPQAFLAEHSIGAMAPFIKEYFPKAKVIPIIFNSNASREDALAVSDWLFKNLDKNSLAIFSIDFSHYLTEPEADKMDEFTERLIKAGGIEAILKLGNDNVDSPASLATALLLQQKKEYRIDIPFRANANDFSPNPSAITTSYFGITFH